MQTVWIYEHAVDLDPVRRVHKNLSRGLLGRRIERSPLPFGRYRWVSDPEPADIDIAECARPRAELSDWADERSQLPVDPETGPGWHIGVLPLTDGSTAVSLVISHYVMDGIGATLATIQAILGTSPDLGYPPPHSRTRLRALVEDARETVRDAPEVARALVAATREARRRRREDPRSAPSRPVALHEGEGDEPVVLPGVTIWIDLNDWDSRAKALGGTSNTLAAGLTAKLAERLGRPLRDDGTVAVELIVNDRTTMDDTRAVAVSFARAHIDPARVTTDLRDARADIKESLKAAQQAQEESTQLVALTPFTPKRGWIQLVNWALNDPDHPVVCSNFGDVGSVISALDGTQCEYGYARGTRQHATRRWLERIGGQLQVQFLGAPGLGKTCIHVLAYQPGAVTAKPALRELIARTLAEFDLTGKID